MYIYSKAQYQLKFLFFSLINIK